MMKVPIPQSYDRAMDWCATHFLPPNKRIGCLRVTWLDTALIAYPTVVALALWAWSGNWRWLPLTALAMAFAWVCWGQE
jgi:hypothetical protein